MEGNASWAATADIVTNGPYTVGTWVKAAQLQTKRNGEYYESKLVVPDSICFRFETDAQTNYDQLLAGELDYTAEAALRGHRAAGGG
ncbi:MAG: ABC transporter substrate-binding protein [Oscillospiraceae bacterium]